jgi:glycosyltransferase involved in cell wall biosynthesis
VLQSSTHCFADGYKLAEDVTAISGKSCDFLPSCRRLPENSIKTLATNPPYKLAFLGRWHKNKGIDLLLESLSLLNIEDWNRIKEIRIHGGGPLDHLVNTQAKILKNKGYPVTTGGYLNVMDANSLFQWADFLLIPSRVESIPVVFSDAMQSNCPVISMPVGDLQYLIDSNHVGVCAKSISRAGFSEALHNALLTPPFLYETAMKSVVSHFSISTVAEHVRSLLI